MGQIKYLNPKLKVFGSRDMQEGFFDVLLAITAPLKHEITGCNKWHTIALSQDTKPRLVGFTVRVKVVGHKKEVFVFLT